VSADLKALKRRAATRAAQEVASGMVVGLGTGSTAALAVQEIGRRLAEGEIERIVGIPTSARTGQLAGELGIPVTTLEEHPVVDLTIDGADEVDPDGNLIKGGGGALLWEKIVAAATRRYLIVVDDSKLVTRLGEGFPVPVEVMPFGWSTHFDAMQALGGKPALRRDKAGNPFVTDGGHYIVDCRFPGGLDDPAAADRTLVVRPGVIETGLFLDMSPEVIVGRPE
jgi:ribose 5-phosphate isomerase A